MPTRWTNDYPTDAITGDRGGRSTSEGANAGRSPGESVQFSERCVPLAPPCGH